MQFHYRKPVDFSFEAIKQCEEQYLKLSNLYAQIEKLSEEKYTSVKDSEILTVKDNFENAMDDDFNTPLAIAEFIRFGKIASKIIKDNNIELLQQANNIVKMFKTVLGFEFDCDTIETEKANTSNNNNDMLELISNIRNKLRESKNYELSDYIRDELSKLNINIADKKLK